MIIQHAQGMTIPTFFQGKIALEIHLPELIGLLHLKALHGLMFTGIFSIDLVIASEDLSNRTGTG
jgi:hypothetical protein